MAQGDINDTTKMLIDIKEDVGATKAKVENIEEKLNQVDIIDGKADKALAKSIEVEHEIGRVTQIQNWLIGVLVSGVLVTLVIYIAEKFL
ncbi:hemolysin XhlA family protein [Lactiplantibacillus plantarum]|uniref:hemolysin XhlA family protein n=1 Tax=Lactiplantibacillus plantarum TaxID=1590 RepID=UPI0015DC7753|nr:hemolysin XhlA family protein [Lactiplantibacillus plantarum]MCK8450916.1 hemolysin XhlA family protein [Lactiplantibacillus plantarum]MDG6763903.1 hemolysin XhlA family protein [Lactiplantibacillus plantarum]MDH2714183.1 hemolysin XhlA family protein [Lactiplantibacillus plantarum]MDH7465862.1 hemolysin XhlA family protein [Lactiplantibacillus plantarum]MDN3214416.1 hemolysin XhlA family protein [Lactiplantibacillus plantarum]